MRWQGIVHGYETVSFVIVYLISVYRKSFASL